MPPPNKISRKETSNVTTPNKKPKLITLKTPPPLAKPDEIGSMNSPIDLSKRKKFKQSKKADKKKTESQFIIPENAQIIDLLDDDDDDEQVTNEADDSKLSEDEAKRDETDADKQTDGKNEVDHNEKGNDEENNEDDESMMSSNLINI